MEHSQAEITQFLRNAMYRVRAEVMLETGVILTYEQAWNIALRISYIVPGFNVADSTIALSKLNTERLEENRQFNVIQ